MTRTRVAVVGTGWWGGHHLRAFAAHRDVELVGLCGRDAVKAAKRAERYGIAAFTDLNELVDRTKPDLVSLAIANQHHVEPTLTILRAGVSVMAEKPLAFELDDADAMLAEAKSRAAFFAICFNHRYARAVQMARQLIVEGKLGDLVMAEWRFGGEGSGDHPFNNLIETQCHGFDMLEHMVGPIASVSAHFSDRRIPGANTSMALTLGFANGAVGALLGSYDASYSHQGAQRLEIVGTAGRILVEDTVRRMTFNSHSSETAQIWEAGYFNDRDRQFQLTLDSYVADMIRAFRAGEPPPVPATAGRRALELAQAAIASHETGTRVEVAP